MNSALTNSVRGSATSIEEESLVLRYQKNDGIVLHQARFVSMRTSKKAAHRARAMGLSLSVISLRGSECCIFSGLPKLVPITPYRPDVRTIAGYCADLLA